LNISRVQPGFFGDKCSVFDTTHALESTPTGADCANLRTAMRGSGGPFTRAPSQTERVQDWHSLDRHADIRVHLAGHTANTTCPLLASLKISGRTPYR